MKKKKLSLAFLLFLGVFNIQSQEIELSYFTLPKELKENANAVVREESMEVIVEDIDQLTTKYKYVATILNKVGHRHFTQTYDFYDDDTKIKKISAKIYNSYGKEIKKYNKSKFVDVSAVSGGSLYEESRVLYVEYTPVTYPFTVVFEVEKTSKTTGFIPDWKPLSNYYLSVQKSRYSFINKTDSEVRTKEKNFKDYPIVKEETDKGFTYVAENVKPIKPESYSPYLKTMLPELKVALTNFSLKGVEGNAKNWKEFGQWMYAKLIKGRDVLPEATKSKILSLVKGVDDPIEKAKIVYQFMQNKTRYISVQVGIGGWEPIAANKVDQVGYGDCKGLTNYMKALLDVVGVTSYYTVVHADEKFSMDEDFASIEGNHVILNVPNNGKDIWLECTSQTIPFGFLGNFTDDRKVLVVTPEGGIIKKTTSYLNEDNYQKITAKVELQSNGSLNAKINVLSKGTQYDEKYPLVDESVADQKKHYKTNRWYYNNNLEIGQFSLQNNKDSLFLKEKLHVSIKGYASVNENDYLLRVNVFNKSSSVPKRYRNRKMPLKISRGFLDEDEYLFKIPEGFEVSVLPLPKILTTKFGDYSVIIKKEDDTTFSYKKRLLIKAGDYTKEDYAAYRKFRKSIAKYENLRISLTKKS